MKSKQKKSTSILKTQNISFDIKNLVTKLKGSVIYDRIESSRTDGRHSFLFWLIVPVILVWLSMSYIVGFGKEAPKWGASSNLQAATSGAIPFVNEYNPINSVENRSFITLWFDDAWLSQYMSAYPLVKSYGYKGVIAVPTDAIDEPGYMNWAQLRVVQKNGWEIANHSIGHDCEMDKWNKDQVIDEYRFSKLVLWKNRLSSDIFTTPCGVDSDTMRGLANKYFLGYRTVNPGYNDLSNLDFYDLKVKNVDDETTIDNIQDWIDYAEENNSWLILVLHRIGEPTDSAIDDQYNTSIEELKQTLDYIKTNEIEVVVPGEILLYTINEK
jgi:peptidoglycan/xylan/chitin deacetylase (PgdA/CDA1 family)